VELVEDGQRWKATGPRGQGGGRRSGWSGAWRGIEVRWCGYGDLLKMPRCAAGAERAKGKDSGAVEAVAAAVWVGVETVGPRSVAVRAARALGVA
jgi:hypothetical protein